MTSFAIIEIDHGLTIATVEPGKTAEEAALAQGGLVVDPGPYTSYDEAYDVMCGLGTEDEERRE